MRRFGRVRASVQLSVFAVIVLACLVAWAALLQTAPGPQVIISVAPPVSRSCLDAAGQPACRTEVRTTTVRAVPGVQVAGRSMAVAVADVDSQAGLRQSWYQALIGRGDNAWWQ